MVASAYQAAAWRPFARLPARPGAGNPEHHWSLYLELGTDGTPSLLGRIEKDPVKTGLKACNRFIFI
jgi:hypothetical protein